jgi:hypothetical protein
MYSYLIFKPLEASKNMQFRKHKGSKYWHKNKQKEEKKTNSYMIQLKKKNPSPGNKNKILIKSFDS